MHLALAKAPRAASEQWKLKDQLSLPRVSPPPPSPQLASKEKPLALDRSGQGGERQQAKKGCGLWERGFWRLIPRGSSASIPAASTRPSWIDRTLMCMKSHRWAGVLQNRLAARPPVKGSRRGCCAAGARSRDGL